MVDRGAVYNKVVVPRGSELIIDDAPMHWRVGQIVVSGKLRIGSEACRTVNPSAAPLLQALSACSEPPSSCMSV